MGARSISLLVLILLAVPARARTETFYVGTYTDASGSQGIYVGSVDEESGKLGPLRLAVALQKDPTFLALSPDGRFLFAALSDAVASFRILPDGKLLAVNRQPSGPNTCHVSLDRTGRELFAASYDAGSIAAYPVGADGRIGGCTATVSFRGSGPNVERQAGPHAHSVYVDPENHFLYACDLGSDRVWIFRLGDHGGLIPASPPDEELPAGSGPRHLAFDGSLVYVVNELGVSTTVFSRNSSTGSLTLIGTEENIDPGWPKGTGSAELAVHPSGKWLYVSTRLEDRMTVFRIVPHIAAVGAASRQPAAKPLGREQVVASPVTFPRSFALDPTGKWLVVAGQTDNCISVMKIDAESGRLAPTGERVHLGSPVCVLFDPSPP